MTAKYGLIGRTLSHSWSPQIHDSILRRLGIAGSYSLYPMEPGDVPGFIKSLGTEDNPCGINVTIPYKQLVMQSLGVISPEARRIGAVNTISLKDGVLTGWNTDYYGFRSSLEKMGAEVAGKSALVLGSGGSARTAVAALTDMGASNIHLASRSPQKAAEEFKEADIIGYDEIDGLGELGILVNTTPAGMHGVSDTTAIPGDRVPFAPYTFDFVYNPINTKLLSISKTLGSETQNGLYMLAAQAAKAQEIWQGAGIPSGIIEEVYIEIMGIMGNA